MLNTIPVVIMHEVAETFLLHNVTFPSSVSAVVEHLLVVVETDCLTKQSTFYNRPLLLKQNQAC